MTSLAHQLKRLALPQNDPSLLARKKAPSLLFDCKEAANIDRDTFFAIACNGLEELMGIDSSFESFQATLFNYTSKSLERSVQTKAVNQQLDENISSFLIHLSPYFMLKPAQKCLEWLIHRFHIHLYNQDSLIGCVLPYHETKVFVRVIQLLKIKDPAHKWNWLQPIQKPGVPLARDTLITHCYKDLGFMDFICTLVTNAVKVFAEYPGSSAHLRVLISFYASTIVAALEAAEKMTDTMVAKLLPYVQKGLKSSLVDYRAATYMIICQLSVKAVMEPSLVHALATQISKTLSKTPSLIRDGLGCLIVLLQTQGSEGLGMKPFSYLCKVPDLVSTIQGIAATFSITSLMRYILPNLVRFLIQHSSEASEELEQSEEVDNEVYTVLVTAVLTEIPLENDLDQFLARAFVSEYISYGLGSGADKNKMSALNNKLLPLVRLLERKYPSSLDLVLEQYLKDVTNEMEQDLFHQFISLSTSGGKYQFLADSDTSLLLSLNHPLPAVRHLALQHLKHIIETSEAGFDEHFIQEAISARLLDDNLDVVLSAIRAFEVFCQKIEPEEKVNSLLNLFRRTALSQDPRWYEALEKATHLLMEGETLSQNEKLITKVVKALLPFMVITSNDATSAEQKMSIFLAKCGLCSLNSLLKGWPEALHKVIKTSKATGFTGAANRKMIQVLADNVASFDSSSLLQMVEDLVKVADNQENGTKQKVTFQVISLALVHGCNSTISQASHLQSVQRIFSLLETKVNKMEVFQLPEEVPDKWHIMSIKDRLLPEELLTEYIDKLNRDQDVNIEDSAMLAFLLKNIIEVLKCPPSFEKGDVWWNPENMDEASRDFVHLLLRLFNAIVLAAGEGSNAINFRALLSFMFKVHLEEPKDLFNFFSLIWTYNYCLSDPLRCSLNAVLHTQSLYIGHALLTCQDAQKKKQIASSSSPVVVSLLINLRSPVREVRRAAIMCLQCFSGVKESPFYALVQGLVGKSEEIIADSAYVSQVLGTIFEELQMEDHRKSRQKSLDVLELLLKCIKTPNVPSYVAKTLMRTLQEVNSEMVLSQLLPAIDSLLEKMCSEPTAVLKDQVFLLHLLLGKYNQHSAALLSKDEQSLDLFFKALHAGKTLIQGIPTFQITALMQITRPFFAALADGKVQQRLLGVLFDLLLNCKNTLCAQMVTSAFKAIVVDAEQVSQELEPQEKNKNLGTVRQTRRQKMLEHQQRKSQEPEGIQEEGNVNWQRVTLILELLQHKKKLKHPELLVPSLFNLLSRSLDPSPSELGSLEYTKQLILSCLLSICQKLSPDGSRIHPDVLDEEKFNVELIVQCVRVSDMPQTHHHALLLLGAAAGLFPDKVLHNIMPIFTFMGANIMRLDDTYSFQVINKTVQTVIPALIQVNNGDSEITEDVEKIVSKIIHVFVDALPHVPEHRRVPILSQLMLTVGCERFLWVLLVLLFEQHVTKTVNAASNGEKDAVLERDNEFWISVCCNFSVKDQLHSLILILQYLAKLPTNKDEEDSEKKKSKARKSKPQEAEQHLFSVESHSGKQLRHFKFLSISFMAQLLSSQSFVGKVVECNEPGELQGLEQRVLEEVLCYINAVANSVEENAEKPTAKFWRALLNKSYEMLDKVNALLPAETFIPVIRGLMANPLPSVRRKAMDLLNNKLQQRVQWQKEQVKLLLGLIGELLSIAHRKNSSEVEEEQAINRQTALYSLKLLCKCFGAQKQNVFVPVLTAAIDLMMFEGTEERNVMGSALLCIAEVTCTLKALAIPQLPRLMPALLKALKQKKELVSSEIYLLSAVTALQKVVETLPHFLSPYLKDSLLQVARLDKIATQVSPTSQLYLRISSLKTTLATKVASRVLLPTITKCYCDLMDTQQRCLGPLMEILKDHIAIMEKQQLVSQQSELTIFFLKALDFRAEHSEGDLQKVGQIEGHVISCLIIMVMKLSEATFRPLFFKLFDWSKTEDSLKDRQLTFYRLTDCLADKLKGLFTLFAGHLVKPFSNVLNQLNLIKTDEEFFDSENIEKSCLLLEFILDCLHKIFLYDTQRFVSKERAEALMMPLVDQLENQLGGEEKFQERVTKHLVPCIAQFSVAMADDSLWKPLNYQILLKMRHSSPKVRFAALIALVELVGKLRENYVVLLPESIPFLAELMEDECEEVESQCQKTIQQLEVILGEPLQSYF